MNRMPDEITEGLRVGIEQQRQLSITAMDKGMRDGMEFAAQLCAAVAQAARGLPVMGDVECAQVATAEFLRDHIRLAALQLQRPEVHL